VTKTEPGGGPASRAHSGQCLGGTLSRGGNGAVVDLNGVSSDVCWRPAICSLISMITPLTARTILIYLLLYQAASLHCHHQGIVATIAATVHRASKSGAFRSLPVGRSSSVSPLLILVVTLNQRAENIVGEWSRGEPWLAAVTRHSGVIVVDVTASRPRHQDAANAGDPKHLFLMSSTRSLARWAVRDESRHGTVSLSLRVMPNKCVLKSNNALFSRASVSRR